MQQRSKGRRGAEGEEGACVCDVIKTEGIMTITWPVVGSPVLAFLGLNRDTASPLHSDPIQVGPIPSPSRYRPPGSTSSHRSVGRRYLLTMVDRDSRES